MGVYIQDLMLEELGDGLEHYQSLGSDLSFCVMRHVRNILLCIIEDFVLGKHILGVAVWDGKCLW